MLDRSRGLIAALLITLGTAVPAQAQPYPSRPIKLVVAVLPGGPMDVMGRLIAQHLSSTLGQVFVENRAGAGTTLGAKTVASAEPDGYTLLLGNAATLAIGPMLYKSAGYDPQSSFAPVAFLASVPYVMIVSPAVPVHTPQQLVAHAKAHPGTLSFGVPNAAPPHMLAAWFKALTGTDIVIVPYKGASAVLTDMLGGQIQAGFETTSVLFGHLQDKKIRALATATRDSPARPARCADHDRKRFSRFRGELMDQHHGARRHAEGGRRQAQCCDQCRAQLGADAGTLEAARRRGAAGNAGRSCCFCCERDPEVAGDGQDRWRQRGMSRRPRDRSLTVARE